eukprot:c18486_g1_i1.p1 GENE.c18486_g1_i1~~c18486_g1_i1.p1  ORF type:complete len:823 (+),score=280.35 c18486_g1_i1:91-2559(+)
MLFLKLILFLSLLSFVNSSNDKESCDLVKGFWFNDVCWFTSLTTNISCNQVCSNLGGKFDKIKSKHKGNEIGMHFYPKNVNSQETMKSIECSSISESSFGVNRRANGKTPDGDWSHKDCYVHCACNGIKSRNITKPAFSYSEQFLSDGRAFLSSSDLEFFDDFGNEQIVGLRFEYIAIPQHSKIIKASIQFQSRETINVPLKMRIFGELSSSRKGPNLFQEQNYDLSNRTKTNSYIEWNVKLWKKGERKNEQLTSDISPIIQQIVSSRNWMIGHPIVIIFERSPNDEKYKNKSNTHFAESGNRGISPQLFLEFLAPSCIERRNSNELKDVFEKRVCKSTSTKYSPRHDLAANCETNSFDSVLAQALANQMYRDCNSHCVFSDITPNEISWIWRPQGKRGCWARSARCLGFREDLKSAIKRVDKLCPLESDYSREGKDSTDFNRLVRLLREKFEANDYKINAKEPNQLSHKYKYIIDKLNSVQYTNHTELLRYPGKRTAYKRSSYLGAGSFSVVYRGYMKKQKSKEYIALKYLTYPVDEYHHNRELKIMETLAGGPNILQLFDVFPSKSKEYKIIVMNYMDNSRHIQYSKFTDWEIRYYLYQSFKALDYVHSKGIIHRDIKPSNIVYDQKKKQLNIGDWGSAIFNFPKERKKTVFGTVGYRSAEVLLGKRNLDYKVDIFALGCIMAGLLFKKIYFFNSQNDVWHFQSLVRYFGKIQIENLIERHKLKCSDQQRKILDSAPLKTTNFFAYITKENFSNQSPEAWHLLRRLLTADPDMRYSAEEALNHPYFDPIKNCQIFINKTDWQLPEPNQFSPLLQVLSKEK